MKITKFAHSCLLVEMPDPINRTVLFDPGTVCSLQPDSLQYLDDIVITHDHSDHFDPDLIAKLVAKFPQVRILAPASVVAALQEQGIAASSSAPEGMALFDAPHEPVEPLFPTPDQIGVHYLQKLTHPGDSLHFDETMPLLALPVQGPWGATSDALKLALQLRPQYVVPIHDWHWNDQARAGLYARMSDVLAEQGVTFIKTVDGQPFVLEV